jgi:fructokinase
VLATDKVDVSGLRFSGEARTALAFVSLRADGERSFMFYRHPSADMLMRSEDVALDVLKGKKIFHFGSITLIGEPSRSATLKAAEVARADDLMISYDPNLRLALWPSADAARHSILAGLDYATVVKVSEEEVEFLTGGQDISSLWRDSIQLIAVTQGADGATIYTRGGSQHVKGFKVQAVDTTGAGDGFVAGLLVGLLEYKDDYMTQLEPIVRFANAVGALTTTQLGAIPALPTRASVEQFMRESH